ncbi:MAG: hypothetical protein MI924_16990 [Chloroflexales bacterium]|nr:hypothetical protein [Chloroflexales bacterium]
MTTLSFDQVLATARQLSPHDRARLVAVVVEELVSDHPLLTENDAWERLQRFREELYTLGPVLPTPAEQLDRDRRERDTILIGLGVDDVHA